MNPFQLFLNLSLAVYMYLWILFNKDFSFHETKIYDFKFDPKAANTAHSYHLEFGTIYSQ